MRAALLAAGLAFATILAAEPAPGVFHPAPIEVVDEISDAERERIEAMLERNVADLNARGLLGAPVPTGALNLAWPLAAEPHYAHAGYHGVSNFVDLNAAFPGQILDYNCGTRSYDLNDGYNHQGIDYFLWPFSWLMMDSADVRIVAAAPGIIIGKDDGNNDRSCPDNFSSNWNAVYVQHADGTVMWYGHMRTGSLTAKGVGASVTTGEYLGLVGSSGFSTGPHLHMELRSGTGGGSVHIEPYAGACRAGPSEWAAQRAYYDSAINRLSTHSAVVNFNTACPNPGQEVTNFRRIFQPGQRVYLYAFFRDLQAGHSINAVLRRPNGTVYSNVNATADTTYSAAYYYWFYDIAGAEPYGRWTWDVTYQSETYSTHFYRGDVIFADGGEV